MASPSGPYGSSGAVRIANCSGFYGDRLSAMREMLTGGELDYVTGDYLAELTMLILGRDRMKHPDRGYAKTFLTQLEESLGLAHDRGVRIVANAGGLNPAGLADAVRALAERLGIPARIGYVEGDDVGRERHRALKRAVGAMRLRGSPGRPCDQALRGRRHHCLDGEPPQGTFPVRVEERYCSVPNPSRPRDATRRNATETPR